MIAEILISIAFLIVAGFVIIKISGRDLGLHFVKPTRQESRQPRKPTTGIRPQNYREARQVAQAAMTQCPDCRGTGLFYRKPCDHRKLYRTY